MAANVSARIKSVKKSFAAIHSGSKIVTQTDTFTAEIFACLKAYKKDMGLLTEQDVVRMAVARFLRNEGYLK